MALSIPPNKMLLLGVLGVGAVLLSRRASAAPSASSRSSSTWPYFLSPSAASGAVPSGVPSFGGAFSTLWQALGVTSSGANDTLGVPDATDRSIVRAGDTYYTEPPPADTVVGNPSPTSDSWMTQSDPIYG